MSHKNPYSKYATPSADQNQNNQAETEQATPEQHQDVSGLLADLMIEPELENVLNKFDGSDLNDEELTILAQSRICNTCPTQREVEDTRLRALADLDNSRKRLAKEKEEILRFAAEGVIGDLLPTLDNLDLALEHARGQEACKNFVIGVDMTRKMLLETLSKRGLVEVGTVGEAFDPNKHEAVGIENNPEVPNDSVVKVFSKGYTLHNRFLRAAKVVVNKLSQ